jgi:Cellulase (glycosyl hydrolase family 5)
LAKQPQGDQMDYSQIKGFNYQPSWGSTGFEIWRNFDAERMGHEVALGKAYFPGMNAIRIWLSHDAWLRNHSRFDAAFETALRIADNHGLSVMPVLFNRWHCPTLDYGGIYIDHFLSKASWVQGKDQPAAFAEAIVGAHAADSRILAWDLCNEPFAYNCPPSDLPDIVKAEYAWLERTYGIAKRCGAQAPITVGIHPGHGRAGLRQIEPISDILSIHPYWTCDSPVHGKDAYEKSLDDYVQFASGVGKPLIATETCWGATDDAKRVEIIHYTLGQLKKRGIGWLVYLLHHSLIADAHRIEFGLLSAPGNLAFIEADGRLRPGHEVFNEY